MLDHKVRHPRCVHKLSRVERMYLFNTTLFKAEVYIDGLGMWHVWVRRGVCRVLVGKPEGKRPLGRPRRRWVHNIRMDLQEVGCGYMD